MSIAEETARRECIEPGSRCVFERVLGFRLTPREPLEDACRPESAGRLLLVFEVGKDIAVLGAQLQLFGNRLQVGSAVVGPAQAITGEGRSNSSGVLSSSLSATQRAAE